MEVYLFMYLQHNHCLNDVVHTMDVRAFILVLKIFKILINTLWISMFMVLIYDTLNTIIY